MTPTKKIFLAFITISCLLWALAPTLFYNTLPHDVAEGVAWGNQWQWGYSKMPPLTAWLCAGITDLFGGNLGFPLYLLAQLCVLVTYIFIWKTARTIADEKIALLSVLLISGIIYYNQNSPNITPDTMSTPVWAMATYYTLRAFHTGRLKHWLLLGLAAALCIYTKYSAPLLLVPLFTATLLHPASRKHYFTKGPFISFACMLFLLMPHILWSIQYHFPAVHYVTGSAMGGADNPQGAIPLQDVIGRHLASFVQIITCQFLLILPVLIVFWPFYFSREKKARTNNLAYMIISASALGPLAINLLAGLITGNHLLDRWSTPYYSFLGLWFLLTVQPILTPKKIKYAIITAVTLFFLIFVGRWAYVNVIIPKKNVMGDFYLDTKAITQKTFELWNAHEKTPLHYIGGGHYTTAYISIESQGKLIPFMGNSLNQSPWINLNKLRCDGAILAYDSGVDPDPKKEFPSLIALGAFSFPYRYFFVSVAPGVSVQYFLLPPDQHYCA